MIGVKKNRVLLFIAQLNGRNQKELTMDKWTELRETIQELHENNQDKPDVENVTRFLLNLMDVLDGKRD